MVDTALAIQQPIDLANFDKKQLRAWLKDQDRARLHETVRAVGRGGVDALTAMASNKALTLVAALVIIHLATKSRMLGEEIAGLASGVLIGGAAIDVFTPW